MAILLGAVLLQLVFTFLAAESSPGVKETSTQYVSWMTDEEALARARAVLAQYPLVDG